MMHRAANPPDELLDAMVRAIVDGVQPCRVILFGSRARGDVRADSDYDLVVELPFEREDYYATAGRVDAALNGSSADVDVDVLVRHPGEIEANRNDPGYMDWDIARDGIVLYPQARTAMRCGQSSLRAAECVRTRGFFRCDRGWSGSIKTCDRSRTFSPAAKAPRGAPLVSTRSRQRRSTSRSCSFNRERVHRARIDWTS
jgi:uncharacterized protein